MGEVIRLARPRKVTIQSAAREGMRDAMQSVIKPHAVVMVVLGEDGTYAMRSASLSKVPDFDMYSRAGALMDRERISLIATD